MGCKRSFSLHCFRHVADRKESRGWGGAVAAAKVEMQDSCAMASIA